MAITKKLNVSFDMKIVFSTVDVEAVTKEMVMLTKKYSEGAKLSGWYKTLVETALEGGVEAAMELHLKKVMAEKLKESLPEDGATISQIRTVFKR